MNTCPLGFHAEDGQMRPIILTFLVLKIRPEHPLKNYHGEVALLQILTCLPQRHIDKNRSHEVITTVEWSLHYK